MIDDNRYTSVIRRYNNNTELINLMLSTFQETKDGDDVYFKAPRLVLFDDSKVLRESFDNIKENINLHFLISKDIYSEKNNGLVKKLLSIGEVDLIPDIYFKKAHAINSEWPDDLMLSSTYLIYADAHDYIKSYHEHKGYYTNIDMIGEEYFKKIYNESLKTINSLKNGKNISAPLVGNIIREAFLDRNKDLINQSYKNKWIIFNESSILGAYDDLDEAIYAAREKYQRQFTLYFAR